MDAAISQKNSRTLLLRKGRTDEMLTHVFYRPLFTITANSTYKQQGQSYTINVVRMSLQRLWRKCIAYPRTSYLL